MLATLHDSALAGAALGAQLDDLLVGRWLPARWAQRLENCADLPVRLEQRVQALPSAAQWRAYTDGKRLWFAIARSVDPSLHAGAVAAMEVQFFENDGAPCAAAIWEYHADAGWRLNQVLDFSPDRAAHYHLGAT